MSTLEAVVTAVDPRTGEELDRYPETPPGAVAALVQAAVAAAADPALADRARRATALRGAAAALRAAGDELRQRCEAESGHSAARVAGELERTCVQLELFADVVAAGRPPRADHRPARPRGAPGAAAGLRRMLVPLGPVAVFGASNFPLAFGVAGGDTAAALAAGCPVIAKGHPSQPGINELAARASRDGGRRRGLPDGTFAAVQGRPGARERFVDAAGVAAVAFTGSTSGGPGALRPRRATRPADPGLRARWGSVNPLVVTPCRAEAARGKRRPTGSSPP